MFREKQDEALGRCARAEEKFKRQLEQLVRGQEECEHQLADMHRRMADNTASAISMGEQLSVTTIQIDSVEAATEVMRYFEELNKGKVGSAVFVDPERIHELESILKNLRMVTSGLPDDDSRVRISIKNKHLSLCDLLFLTGWDGSCNG